MGPPGAFSIHNCINIGNVFNLGMAAVGAMNMAEETVLSTVFRLLENRVTPLVWLCSFCTFFIIRRAGNTHLSTNEKQKWKCWAERSVMRALQTALIVDTTLYPHKQ